MRQLHTLSRSTRYLFVLCLFILLGTPRADSYAQSPDDVDVADRWALQFQVNNNFTLSEFQGGLISAKKQYDARRAFRFGVSFGVDRQGQTTEQTNADGESRELERTDNSQNLALNAQWIRYFADENRIKAYWGIGPAVGFSRRVVDQETQDFESRTLSLSGGAEGLIGVEWFLHSRVSLTAEYGVAARYLWRQSEEPSDGGAGTFEQTTNTVRLADQSVLFGVSVYF